MDCLSQKCLDTALSRFEQLLLCLPLPNQGKLGLKVHVSRQDHLRLQVKLEEDV